MAQEEMKWDERGFLLRNYVRVDQAKQMTNDVRILDEFASNRHINNVKVLDLDWVRTRFGISNKELSDERLAHGRFFTTASFKYSDTRLGGHLACNPKPQWTRYCDIRPRYNPTFGRSRKPTDINPTKQGTHLGMGQYYSEAIDDNANLVFLTFGVKKFNGLLDFMMSAIDYGDVVVANTGRKPIFYNVGKMIGTVVVFSCIPITASIIWAVKAISKFLNMNNSYDYYYMKPTMHSYWSVVNNLATQLATELKLISPIIENLEASKYADLQHDLGAPSTLNKDELQAIADILGYGLFDSKTGWIDVFGVMAHPQAMYRDFLRRKKAEHNVDVPMIDGYGAMLSLPSGNEDISSDVNESAFALSSSQIGTFQSYLDKAIKSSHMWDPEDNDITQSSGEEAQKVNSDISAEKGKLQDSINKLDRKERSSYSSGFTHNFNGERTEDKDPWYKNFMSTADSVIHDGGLSAIFSVDFPGSQTESFSNDIRDIDTGGMIKSVASTAQDFKFNFSGGNLGGPIDTGAIMGAVKETIMGGASGVTMGLTDVLATIFGDAYIDIPKRWSDSSVSFPSITYNMKLACVYGNAYSMMQSIGIPLCMLLAGTLPLATGKASYTSPFLCSLNMQGMQNIKLGMITSLSITRGTTNLPFTKSRKPLGVDVSFTVTDFSTLTAAPVVKGIFDEIMTFGMDDTTPLGRYLATLAGRDIQTEKYTLNKVGQRLSRTWVNIKSIISPHRRASYIGDMLNGPLSLFTAQGNMTTSLPGVSVRAE